MTADEPRRTGAFFTIAMLIVMVSQLLPVSPITRIVSYAGLAYATFSIGVDVRDGYIRRRATWTRESWLRFATACLFPIGAVLIGFTLLELLDLRLPITGARESMVRRMWALGTLMFLGYGGIGVGSSIVWLTTDGTTQQFEWSPRRFWRRAPASR